jgi:superoxide dismutase
MCADCHNEFVDEFTEHEKECDGKCSLCLVVKREKELGIFGAGPAERAFILNGR